MIVFEYNKKEDIIYIRRSGKIFINDLIENVKKLDEAFLSKECLKIIDDVRGAEVHHNYDDDLELLMMEVKDRIKKYDFVKSAMITDNPSDTAIAMIYEKMAEEVDKYYFKVFSTIEAAKLWL